MAGEAGLLSGTFQPKEEEQRERVSGGECPAKSLMGYRVVPLGKWSQGALLGTSRGPLPVPTPEGFSDSIKLDNAIMRNPPCPLLSLRWLREK